MIGKSIFFILSLLASGTTIRLFTMMRMSGLQDQRMKGFNSLCTVVPFWIIVSASASIAEPDVYPIIYVLKSLYVNVIPYMSIWFLLHFTESKIVKSRVLQAVLIIMPILSSVSLLTNPLHYMHYTSTPIYASTVGVGPLFIIHMIPSLGALFIVYCVLFRYITKNYRKQPLIFLTGIGAVLPVVMYMMYLFTPVIIYDITAIGYFFTIGIFVFVSYRARLRNAKPGILGDTLAEVAKSKEISRGMPEEAAVLIAKESCYALNTYRVAVWILDEQTQDLKNIAYYTIALGEKAIVEDLKMIDFERYKALLVSERVIAISDIKEYFKKNGLPDDYDDKICAMIGAPIRVGDKLIGVVCVEQNHCNAFPMRREWSAEEQAFVSSLADIMAIAITNAERQKIMHRLEIELSERTEFNNMAFTQSPMGQAVLGDNYEVLDCNDAILTMFGVTREYYMENFAKFSPEFQPDGSISAARFTMLRQQAVEKGRLTFEWMHNDIEGNLIPCEVTIANISQRNKNIAISYVYDLRNRNKMLQSLRDTSAQLEEALHRANEASKAKTDFLAKMSHEIRTPMNAIIGMTELALRDDDIRTKDEHIYTVKQAGSNLLAIISDILDFSKIESGKMEIITADYSVSSLIDDMVSIIRMRVVDLPIRFAVMVDSNVPRVLHGDETRIRQSVLNILNNATKYTSKGYVTLSVTTESAGNDEINLIFKVKDTGRGIKRADIDKLFEEFSQFDVEKNKGIEGVGLGLSIAQKIVKTMGGDISVESEYGKGSVFTVSIPQKCETSEGLAHVDNPDDKGVIIYERRDLYADSISYALKSLKVPNLLVTKEAELCEGLKSRKYSFLFIPYALLKKVEDTVLQYGKEVEIVVLTEFGEAIPGKHRHILSMPVFCTSIADMLNGVYSTLTFTTDGEFRQRFTSPDARVLLVDDIYTNLKVAEGLLTPYKMKVDLCNSGAAAIDAVNSTHYDLIFMDHKMPGMDGVETTVRIKEMGIKTPIIALTANAVAGVIEMFLEKGFDDSLTKPIDTVRLNAILEKWIPINLQIRQKRE